ncbi:PSD1 and planctomycete cytochrome C domain-containing protein [Roseimaritima ulvae]|uniref:Planctomycete cytochrome C n=1 Tax=Roseimaritima ulvae TaxID=980254 RepID=A0A5B9QHL8_9BACT|nr:PSD1 and planctomycete cytochrome C domain-containing protein [Roseimaritima ulvae]QEG38334.1 Planctomycete cytochrome C [Roseimaritima ulvae]
MRVSKRFAGFALSLLAGICAAADIDFTRDIRPILSENCVFCHGPDEATREADLRLDTEAGALAVIDPEHSGDSELFRRLTSEDADELMPPPDSNRRLTPPQIELIRQWIDVGAKWEQHWSFRPLVAPPVPPSPAGSDATVRNPIDAFVQHRLAEQGLRPAPQADRPTLIRRLSLDLTGLPPTPAEVDAFVADNSADAYERLVERLLDSPAYGQRMAWDWLDAARYADTNGYQGDRERTMWPWRDWVVRAFNDNLPFDQFTRWQIAGDLLPDASEEQILATGFLRNHMINGEGGRIPEENRVEYVMDMSETMGTVWLGLTLNCCRCHDHKYDPLTNEEYYQFFAFFNQTPVTGGGGDPQTAPNLAVPSDAQRQELADIDRAVADLDAEIQALTDSLLDRQADWEQSQRERLADAAVWRRLSTQDVQATASELKILDDGSVLSLSNPAPDNDTYTVSAPLDPQRITGLRLETLRHESFPENSLSHAGSGNFVLTAIEVWLEEEASGEATPVPIDAAKATFEQPSHGVDKAFDDNPKTGWAVYEGRRVDRSHAAVFRFTEPLQIEAGYRLKVILRHESVHVRHNIGRFRLSLTDVPQPQLPTVSDALLAALRTPAEQRSDDQRKLLRTTHHESVPELQTLQQRRAERLKRRQAIRAAMPKVMVMGDMEKPRPTFMLERGLYNQPGDPVQPRLPAFLPASLDQQNANRLTLANWLVSDENPLTTRVTVNRFWQQLFGVGLVKTTEDFGAQGEIPVQMDLLNWLASHFRDNGWDVKDLMRLIVTSHTYRQSSKIRDLAVAQRDPENRLLSRGARYRLPAWMLRDQVLAASGLLSPVAEGPAINTYQPAGVWEEASFGKKKYRQDEGEKLYRRSLYVFWRRIIAPTMFFDSASRQTCTVNQSRTNTPLHALQTLNNTIYVEAARVLAEAVLQADLERDAQRIEMVFRRLLARDPEQAEQAILLAGLKRTRTQYAGRMEEARKLLAIGQSPRDRALDPIEHAVWTNLCLAVSNLDETLNHE